MSAPTTPLQILDNKNGTVSFIWDRDATGVTKFYRLYMSVRKSGTYVLVKDNIQNAVGYGSRYVRLDISRTDLGIPNSQQAYFYLSEVDWYGVETPAPGLPSMDLVKILYEDGITLTSSTFYRDVDIQAAGATNVDFTTTDRFNGLITHVIVSRSTSVPLTITVSLTATGVSDLVIAQVTGYTDPVFGIDQNQQVPELENRHVRVQVTGLAGGSAQVIVVRRRLYLYQAADF